MQSAQSPRVPLRLKKNEHRRLRAGHLWVFSNEVDTALTPLTELEPGQLVELQTHQGRPLGLAYANPHSLICARVLSRDKDAPAGQPLLTHRLKVALSLRERLYPEPFYRLVHGEGDHLPGLVVDRYGDVLVVQLNTAGMERFKEELVAALDKVIRPRVILFRNDSALRRLEGLDLYVESRGNVPEQVLVPEAGVRYRVPLSGGQKTGWFYDQRPNRHRLRHYAGDRRVLDVFSYLGGWGLQAAAAGAERVLCVDSSQTALETLLGSAGDNELLDRVEVRRGDASEVLRELRQEGQRYDVVVLDPPAFIKRKKDAAAGEQAYHRLNQLGMQLLTKDGILVSCSCSYHLRGERLQQMLVQGSRHLDRSLQLLERGHQGPDHPVHPAIAETEYLKALFCRVLPTA